MRREEIKQIAVDMVKQKGLINLSRNELCAKANIPDGSWSHVMGCSFSDFVAELQDMGIAQNAVPVSKRRVPAAMRKQQILEVAINEAKKSHYNKITRDGVAEAAGVSMGLVTKYFGTMQQLRTQVIRHAVKQSIIEIIAQGIASNDDRAKKASQEDKQKAIELLTE